MIDPTAPADASTDAPVDAPVDAPAVNDIFPANDAAGQTVAAIAESEKISAGRIIAEARYS